MKRVLLCAAAICSALTLLAQPSDAAKTGRGPKPLVSDSYARNSISVVLVDRGDRYDKRVTSAVQGMNLGRKYDINKIKSNHIQVDSVRSSKSGTTAINSRILRSNIGQEVIGYWFDSDNNGMMEGTLVERRGRYNVRDQDVLNASSAKIGESALSDTGYALINSSYIVVLDYSAIEKGKNSSDEPTESVTLTTHVYKVEFPEESQNSFYDQCWIDQDTPASEVASRRAAFRNLMVPVAAVATTSVSSTVRVEDGGLEVAIQSAYSGAMNSLESQIDAWKVTVSIQQTRPLGAKIGTKEGLSNTDRYIAYETKRKQVDGEDVTYSAKRGYVRATYVADNASDADGRSPMSEFYQISHMQNIRPGYVLKESNDMGMGVAAAYNIGNMSIAKVTIDYLMSIGAGGVSSYMIMDFGYDVLSASKLRKEGFVIDGTIYNEGLSFLNCAIGYGYGFRPGSRLLEIVPAIYLGADYMQVNSELDDDSEESNEEFIAKTGFYGRAGVKANLNIAYPLQLVVGVDYSLIVYEGEFYKRNNESLATGGCERTGGLALSLGLKYIF